MMKLHHLIPTFFFFLSFLSIQASKGGQITISKMLYMTIGVQTHSLALCEPEQTDLLIVFYCSLLFTTAIKLLNKLS